jgi:hypothetical protein
MSAYPTNAERINTVWTRIQALPLDLTDERGVVLAHFIGGLESMTEEAGKCSLPRVIAALERAVTCAEGRHEPEPAPRPRSLTCCVCGTGTRGVQWWNRDTGYGICTPCGEREALRESPTVMQSYYGVRGVNYSVPSSDQNNEPTQ